MRNIVTRIPNLTVENLEFPRSHLFQFYATTWSTCSNFIYPSIGFLPYVKKKENPVFERVSLTLEGWQAACITLLWEEVEAEVAATAAEWSAE